MDEEFDEYGKHVKRVNDLLSRLLDEVRPMLIPDRAESISELIYVGEQQLALEILVDGLELAECEINRDLLERLKQVADIMELKDDTLFSYLEKKIRD